MDVKIKVENRSRSRVRVSPEELEQVLATSGIRDALEDVSVLATFHDYDVTRENPRDGCVALLDSTRQGCVRIRVKVFVPPLEEFPEWMVTKVNEVFAHEMKHAAQYALYGVGVAFMDADALEDDAIDFALTVGKPLEVSSR